MGLAYEIVINSNPCISYLMEENTMAMQALVIAHAAYGHNSFFKGNYLFRMWTDAGVDHRLPGLCQELRAPLRGAPRHRCGRAAARQLPRADEPRRRPLQAGPASSASGRSSSAARTAKPTRSSRSTRCGARCRANQRACQREGAPRFPKEPQENLLYFIEKNAPLLEPWQREIVRIVRKVAQYFYPQRQTQVMNEGWATFWHHTLLNTMYDDGHLDRRHHDRVAEVAHQCGVPADGRQPPLQRHQPVRAGLRDVPDIKRICERRPTKTAAGSPTSPARLAGDAAPRDARTSRTRASSASSCRRADARVPAVLHRRRRDRSDARSVAIHDEAGYRAVREAMSRQYDLGAREPNIQVWGVNLRGDRSLMLRHTQHNERPLHNNAHEVLKHVARLWGFGCTWKASTARAR
jgi:stage V sporulation protein R